MEKRRSLELRQFKIFNVGLILFGERNGNISIFLITPIFILFLSYTNKTFRIDS